MRLAIIDVIVQNPGLVVPRRLLVYMTIVVNGLLFEEALIAVKYVSTTREHFYSPESYSFNVQCLTYLDLLVQR